MGVAPPSARPCKVTKLYEVVGEAQLWLLEALFMICRLLGGSLSVEIRELDSVVVALEL